MRFCASLPALAEQVESMRKLMDHTISTVRNVASQLRPAAMNLGLEAAAEWLASEFRSRTGVACTLSLPSKAVLLDDESATTVFRILQESLTNVSRHAAARQVDISLHVEMGYLVVQVRDDGRGFEQSTISEKNSFGLMGIRERAIILGGEAHLHSVPGEGTVVTARIPCQAQHADARLVATLGPDRLLAATSGRRHP
ncbi:MAG: hypothetical protein B7Z52_01765 [Burkholderiales bacterium 12-64-5]|nr:MAG: hypothetical protein B7Z52_01765 [Burkholderiales bacterium 12-64-5]